MLQTYPTDGAMGRALRRIHRECSGHRLLKERIRHVLREPDHPAVGIRYGRGRALHGLTLDAACYLVARQYAEELRQFSVAAAFGYGNRLSLEILRELRLILRWMRCKRMAGSFSTIVAEIGRRAA